MNMRFRSLAAVAAVGIVLNGLTGLAAGTAQAAPAATVRIRVVGVSRDGHQVPVYATIFSLNFYPVFAANGRAVTVDRGLHWIGASVPTLENGLAASQTLVLRQVMITRSETVRLDARGGAPVRFSLAAPGAIDTQDTVVACVGGKFVGGAGVQAGGQPGTVYAVPVRDRALTFGYGSEWTGPAAGYGIAGQRSGGIPARPRYHLSPAGMARLTISMRDGTAAGGYNNPLLTPAGSCGVVEGLGLNPANGLTVTQYVSPGTWTIELNGFRGTWGRTLRMASGHRYAATFGAAVWGPGNEAPREGGGTISYYPQDPFADPAQPNGFECCDKSSITLLLGRHVIKHEVLSEWRASRDFTARAPSAGWYTLRFRAWRWTPGLTIPAGLLSRSETVAWRFYAAPRSIPAGYDRELPAYVVRVRAGGLNIRNQAPASGVTPLAIDIVRTHDPGNPPAPVYRITALRMQASSDGGKTWQPLRVVRRGSLWMAVVHDPASGFVALRAFAKDAKGDSVAQTIYRAYAVG